MYWEKEIETMPLADLKNIQSERLSDLCKYIYLNNPVYKSKLDISGMQPDKITSIEDVFLSGIKKPT